MQMAPITDAVIYEKPQRQLINPLIPICTIGLVLFLLATTIVLALIPVYLTTRNAAKQNFNTAPFKASLVLQNGTLPFGSLNTQNCQAIQTLLRQWAQSSSAVNPSVPTLTSCTVSGNAATGRRKKRQGQGNQVDVVGYLSAGGTCHYGLCVTTRAQAFTALLLTTGQFILNLIISGGTSANIAANFISSSLI